METNNVESLLNWLKVQPRTLDWGAVMAYGRSETNKVLLQEYIERFSTSNYLRPITEEILDNATPTQKEFLHNYQMDAPRLSFKDSNLNSSAARATMQVVGGSHLTFNKPAGSQQWSVTRIAHEDVLDGPQLGFDIDLLATTGSVTSAGRVELNISTGTNYRLTYVQTEHLRKVAGQRMQEIFRRLPDDQTIFVLNELKFEPDQFLKPDRFVIRTHNKKDSGARLLAGEDEGEGSVLVFVALEGDANGTVPVDNADLKYLLPDGYSATVLLGHELFFKKMFVVALQKLGGVSEIKYDIERSPDRKRIVKIIGRSGERKRVVEQRFSTGGIDYVSPQIVAPVHTSSELDYFEMNISQIGSFSLEWKEVRMFHPLKWTGGNSGSVSGKWSLVYGFEYDLDTGGELVIREADKDVLVAVTDQSSIVTPAHKVAVEQAYTGWLSKFFEEGIGDFLSAVENINVFTLNSLLFRGSNAVKFEDVHYPADLALFGHVGPTQTAFAITQLEPVIGYSETLQFTTEPPRSDLSWKVENILGETVPVGSIDASSGRYTAPTAAQLEGNFVRARVTATAGGHTSSALVTVMRRGITVNPMIQIATAGDPLALDVSAGAVDGGELTWTIEDPSSGAVVKPNPADGGDHSYVPGPPKAGTAPTVDTLVVHNPRTKLSETARVLVLHRPALLSVVIVDKPGLPEHQIQLAIMGEEGPIDPGDWGESWQVLLGSGSAEINATTGLLTVNPAGPDKFVAITVLAPPARPGGAPDDGYIILPLPLFSVPETLRMLGANGE
ncbi:hypothetical protein [Pseudomonas sp. GL-RE-26]|uniref:hypothetical protein n=1 Tax=Pseudomonas sp. GL-RE-26 TaxID=2832390 RepID=UPI001CC0C6AE|nr:hypothetical protein [Pseudomonas sp. GL-RE-26]